MLCTAICAFLGSSTAAPSCFSVVFLYLNDPKVIWDKIWKSKEFLFVPVHGTYCIDCIDVKNCWKKGNRPLMASTYQSGCQKICLPRSDARLVAENIWKLEFGIQHPTDQCAGSSLPGGLNQLFHHAEVMLFDLGFDFVKLRFSPPQQLRFCSNCKLSASSRDPKKLRGKEAFFFARIWTQKIQQVALEEAKTTSKPTLSLQDRFPTWLLVTAVRRNPFHGCHRDVSKSLAAVKCCKLQWILPIFFHAWTFEKGSMYRIRIYLHLP